MGVVGREYGMRAFGMGGWLQNQGGRGPGEGGVEGAKMRELMCNGICR